MFQRIGLDVSDEARRIFSETGSAEQAANSKLRSDSNPAAEICCIAVSSSACNASICLLEIKAASARLTARSGERLESVVITSSLAHRSVDTRVDSRLAWFAEIRLWHRDYRASLHPRPD